MRTNSQDKSVLSLETAILSISNDSCLALNTPSFKTKSKLQAVKHIIDSVPRRGYVKKESQTPVEFMPNLSNLCGNEPSLYVKRDDLLPLAGGGSKTRKLDFLIQEALDQGADTVITSGAVQSNHCRLTASAAAREGLECHLILEERVPQSYDPGAGGNNYIFSLLGAKTTVVQLGGTEMAQHKLVEQLEANGKKIYIIPGGGSNSLGALGYVECAIELIEESDRLKRNSNFIGGTSDLFWDAIVCCSGSGGTHAGLLTGLRACGIHTPVVGISVRFNSIVQRKKIHDLCQTCVDSYFSNIFVETAGLFPKEDVVVDDNYIGGGYSIPSEEMAEAVQKFARLESILLDPVYTGKGAAGFLAIAKSGKFSKDQRLLFIHTGGAPSTFHYRPLPLERDLPN